MAIIHDRMLNLVVIRKMLINYDTIFTIWLEKMKSVNSNIQLVVAKV